jgi:hypothetical protein
MSRRLLLLAGAALLCAALIPSGASASASASAAAASRGCVPRGAVQVEHVAGVREYYVRGRDPVPYASYSVCADRTGRRVALAYRALSPRGWAGEFVNAIRFAGNYVAAGLGWHDSYGRVRTYVRRVDLSTGRRQDTAVNCKNCSAPLQSGSVRITDLALTRLGNIAWIAEDTDRSDRYVVGRRDSRGRDVLARGAGIDPHSLAVRRSTLYWLQDGRAQDADLY